MHIEMKQLSSMAVEQKKLVNFVKRKKQKKQNLNLTKAI